jgi:N-methylhydantoinase B
MGLILASAGKAVAQNAGLCGGHPGNTGLDVIARNSRISELLAAGHMPSDLAEISGTLEPGQNYADPRRL